jgi:hypothetical protein
MAQHSVALLGLILFSVIAQAGPSQKITSLGTFSNYRFTEEHQYGTGLQLWQEGTSLFGLFSYSQGLIGDTPTGVLEKVSFDPKTGHITFTAKLTIGLHSCNVHRNGVPSQDIFHFEGVLSNMSLSGTLMHADNLHQDQVPTKENIVLKKSDEWVITQFRNREQWETSIKDILKFRGPKW